MPRDLKAVIFDFDFTLADSSSGIIECVTAALAELGISAPPIEKIVATIGLSLADTLKELSDVSDVSLARRFAECFHQRADQTMEAATVIYDCVRPMLLSLRAVDLRTAIVTTKLNRRIRSILASREMLPFFDVIVGAEDVKKTKPDPEGLLLALARLGVRAGSAVYVGDHVIDAQAAQGA
ncbi:MAG TPA: HAD-IA family hydrolase, partial [Terriglobales bacterium]|nr:HAD-IA family hydrolase [Terriglobales bacterium]